MKSQCEIDGSVKVIAGIWHMKRGIDWAQITLINGFLNVEADTKNLLTHINIYTYEKSKID